MRKKFKVVNPNPGNKNISMEGLKFGLLTVVKHSHNDKYQNKVWECLCDCGNTTFSNTTSLNQGRVTSCKCNQYKKGKNVYNYTGYEDISGAKWYSIKQNAKVRDLEISITKEDVWNIYLKQDKKCNYTGLSISFLDGTASVDRIDSDKGYNIDNIVIVHKDINRMKSDFSVNYFIELCKLVNNKN